MQDKNNKYQIIQLCRKCKAEKLLEVVESEFRVNPVYKMVDECEKCAVILCPMCREMRMKEGQTVCSACENEPRN